MWKAVDGSEVSVYEYEGEPRNHFAAKPRQIESRPDALCRDCETSSQVETTSIIVFSLHTHCRYSNPPAYSHNFIQEEGYRSYI